MRGAPPDRIGHGTFLHPDVGGTDEIVQEVTSRATPIGKVCDLCIIIELENDCH